MKKRTVFLTDFQKELYEAYQKQNEKTKSMRYSAEFLKQQAERMARLTKDQGKNNHK